jgi:hypothetical protein
MYSKQGFRITGQHKLYFYAFAMNNKKMKLRT